MKTLLVTGGAGFIGSNFVRKIVAERAAEKIIVLDALSYAGNLENLIGLDRDIEFVHGKIQDESLLDKLFKQEISHIAHFAAESHVDRSIHFPDAFIETNVLGTHALLKAAHREWKNRAGKLFLHVSTDEVFGSLRSQDPAFQEKTPYAPNSPYAASKAASDHFVRAYHHTFGLPTITTNCSNNYGAYQFPEKLIPLMIIHILEGKPLPIYGDGKQIRDWLHVSDHCDAILLVMQKGRIGETYAIGGKSEVTNLEIVQTLCELLEEFFTKDSELIKRHPKNPFARGEKNISLLQYVTDRPGHDRRYAIDPRKIETELGFQPRENLKSGLKKTVAWYLQNEIWWKNVLSGNYRQWHALNYGARHD